MIAKGTAMAQGKVSPTWAAVEQIEQTYRLGTPKGGTQTVKGSTKLNTFSPDKLKRFVSKAGGVLAIAKALPPQIKVPALLTALAAVGYTVGKTIDKWKDNRTGKTGKIPKALMGTPTPKDTGPTRLTAKPDPLKKFLDTEKARGGKVKKTYAKGGGVRKAQTYG